MPAPPPSGHLRALVPFFVPAPDGAIVVNESLTLHSTTTSNPKTHPAKPLNPAPTLIELPVRTWDHDAGVFRDAVHIVRDLPPPASHSQSPLQPHPHPQHSRRLLTPADIRAARKAARNASTSSSPVKAASHMRSLNKTPPSNKRDPSRTSSPSRVVKTSPQLLSTTPTKPSSPSPATSPNSTPVKQRAFAGSTFESASPPPAGLPIPAFVKRSSPSPQPLPNPRMKDVVSSAQMGADACEKAALDLRRMLKI